MGVASVSRLSARASVGRGVARPGFTGDAVGQPGAAVPGLGHRARVAVRRRRAGPGAGRRRRAWTRRIGRRPHHCRARGRSVAPDAGRARPGGSARPVGGRPAPPRFSIAQHTACLRRRPAGHACRRAHFDLARVGRGRLLGPGPAIPESAGDAGRQCGVAGAVPATGAIRRPYTGFAPRGATGDGHAGGHRLAAGVGTLAAGPLGLRVAVRSGLASGG